ncbi:MAG: nitroreductase family protein, partial [Bacteroidales bacterium]|nr:nitroreductase family protein [Bacteroidales bacterium]
MKSHLFIVIALAAGVLAGCKEGSNEAVPAAMDVIMTRTSIRIFNGEAVPREQLETILKAGMAAPSAMNVQPWRFVVLTDKDRIAELFGGGFRPEAYTSAG